MYNYDNMLNIVGIQSIFIPTILCLMSSVWIDLAIHLVKVVAVDIGSIKVKMINPCRSPIADF